MNQLVESVDSTTGETTVYTYDDYGNLISDGKYEYSYDEYYNRLDYVRNLETDERIWYEYYVDGLRKCKDNTYFIWLDGNMVYEFTSDDNSTYTYGHRLLYSDDYKYVLNAHGDVVALLNSDGETVKAYDYDAFGNELNPSASDTNPFRYCAEYFDIESGQIYLRNRYYQPVTGRFTQLDPIKDGLNWYAYCLNNPVVFVDSKGLWPSFSDIRKWIYEQSMKPVNWFEAETKAGNMEWLLNYGLGAFQDESGIYHIRQDWWQRYAGYNNFYDFAFEVGIGYTGASVDFKKSPFTYNETEYIFWAWKGDYLNLGAGAELGIYTGGEPNWKVDTALSMPMTLTLYDNKGNQIYHYAPSEPQWWITGFDAQYQNVQACDLIAVYTINFSQDHDMYNAFCSAYGDDPAWSFDSNNYTATLTF